mmetsp:Transcript_39962/g.132188  ORF Transcript_39962/g.132188 Transcript_39962/m.132188 type:complete len:200 (-) Transcript_39962:588-1187(-)
MPRLMMSRACASPASSCARPRPSSSDCASYASIFTLACSKLTTNSAAKSCICSSCAVRSSLPAEGGLSSGCRSLSSTSATTFATCGLPAQEMAYSAAHALSCSCLDAAFERSFSTSFRCAATQSSSSFEGWCSRAIEYMQDAACSAAVPLSSIICSSIRKRPASMSPLLYSGVALKARNLSARAAASFSSRLPSPSCAR